MKSIHIRDLSEPVLHRLKLRAKRHHRSLQGELQSILAEAARLPLLDETQELVLKTVKSRGKQDWSREGIYED